MQRHFKVKAKADAKYRVMGKEVEIVGGEIYEAQDLVVTVNGSRQVRLGVRVKPDALLDLDIYRKNFDEI